MTENRASRAPGDEETWFASHLALGNLPYFDVQNGRLVADSDAIGPVVDVHTHLALTFGRKPIDLLADGGAARHYLPMERPVDLEGYQNLNFTQVDMRAMEKELGLKSLTRGGEMRLTHTVPALLGEMDELGVAVSVLLPIELPLLSWNAEAYIDAAASTDRLISMGSVHPKTRTACERLQAQKERGAIGVKIHPAVQMVPADHPGAMAIYRAAGELGLPVFWHCGPVGIENWYARRCSQVKHYWKAIQDNPQTTFILGHSGALQMEMGLALAQQYPNAHLELTSQSLSHVRHILREGPVEKVMYGSDWPFYHQAIGIAKVLMATEGDEALRAMVLRENAARLFGLDVRPPL